MYQLSLWEWFIDFLYLNKNEMEFITRRKSEKAEWSKINYN